ncbi:MAG: MBL fold metallo-hydrolase [Promethearchaeota archaeon]
MPFQNVHKEQKIKFVELNKLFATHSIAEHGLGFLINIYEIDINNDLNKKKILFRIIFDTGGSNLTFIHNLNIRGYQIYDINSIILSHWHYDHTGALYKILRGIENDIPLICHESAQFERFFRRKETIKFSDLIGKTRKEILPMLLNYEIVNQEPINVKLSRDLGGKVIFSKKNYELFNHDSLKIIASGEIPRNYDIEDFNSFYILQDNIIKNDKILDDKSLIFEYEDNVVLLTGCCHSGIMNTLDYIKSLTEKPISHIIGGFHMANASNQRIKKTIDYLESFQKYEKPLYLFPLHCSGEKFLFESMKMNSPDLKAFNVSVGTIFTF